jgi:hypothetical protein
MDDPVEPTNRGGLVVNISTELFALLQEETWERSKRYYRARLDELERQLQTLTGEFAEERTLRMRSQQNGESFCEQLQQRITTLERRIEAPAAQQSSGSSPQTNSPHTGNNTVPAVELPATDTDDVHSATQRTTVSRGESNKNHRLPRKPSTAIPHTVLARTQRSNAHRPLSVLSRVQSTRRHIVRRRPHTPRLPIPHAPPNSLASSSSSSAPQTRSPSPSPSSSVTHSAVAKSEPSPACITPSVPSKRTRKRIRKVVVKKEESLSEREQQRSQRRCRRWQLRDLFENDYLTEDEFCELW